MEHKRHPSSGGGSTSSTTTTSNSTSTATQIHQQLQHFEISSWERKSKISIEQALAVNNLSKAVLDKPLPLKFQDDPKKIITKTDKSSQQEQDNSSIVDGEITDGEYNLPSKPIDNLGHFFDWFTLIEKTSNHLHQYEWFLETIISYGEGSNHLLDQVNGCEHLVNSIQSDYLNLTKKTNQLHESCEKFFKEELRLRYIVQTIHEKLKYFLELEQNTKKFNSSTFTVTDHSFLSSLETLEDCIQFMKKNPNYLESSKYSLQYNLLFTRALGLIKDYISACLKTVTAGIVAARTQQSQNNNNNTNNQDIDSDTSFDKIKFRAFAPKLRPLCQELERRAIGQYSQFLTDTYSIYFRYRNQCLSQIINQKLVWLSRQTDNIPLMIQNICMFMIGVYEDEYEIYCDYFDKEKELADFSELLDPFTQSMYDYVRPVYIHITNYELLCNLAHIIRNELLEEVIEHTSTTKICSSLKLVFQRMLQDIQERLIFIIQTYIRDEISLYHPSSQDLNYPTILTQPTPPTTPPLSSTTTTAPTSGTTSPQLPLPPPPTMKSKGLYPTLDKTLTCLSKLYLVVDTKIFEGLAQEAVSSCMYSLIQASSLIAADKSNPLAMVDSQLFLIKYFITLREQITPFDINFVIEKIVDFPQLKHALQSLYNYGSLFKFSTNNPIYNMLTSAANPRVTSTSIDAKKDLEKELKGVIETFIISSSNKIIDPLVALLTKISVFINSMNNQQQQQQPQPHPLSTQPFATVERIKEVVEQVQTQIETFLPQVVDRMKIYLTPATLALLSKPIRTNIIDSFDQINQYSKKYYSEEQVKAMSLVSMDRLKVLLDQHVPTQLIINTSNPNK